MGSLLDTAKVKRGPVALRKARAANIGATAGNPTIFRELLQISITANVIVMLLLIAACSNL